MKNEIPRRNRIDLFIPVEKAIFSAVQMVEELPADVRLTDAVILLGKAKDAVADFLDSKEGIKYLMSQAKPV